MYDLPYPLATASTAVWLCKLFYKCECKFKCEWILETGEAGELMAHGRVDN